MSALALDDNRSSKNGAIALSRTNFFGYIGHVTKFTSMLTTVCCLVVLGLGIGFGTPY